MTWPPQDAPPPSPAEPDAEQYPPPSWPPPPPFVPAQSIYSPPVGLGDDATIKHPKFTATATNAAEASPPESGSEPAVDDGAPIAPADREPDSEAPGVDAPDTGGSDAAAPDTDAPDSDEGDAAALDAAALDAAAPDAVTPQLPPTGVAADEPATTAATPELPSPPDWTAQFADVQEQLRALSAQAGEIARLRKHDADLADRMHAEIVRLRSGELTQALAPLLSQLLRLHDRMVSLAGGDDASVAGMLRTQLVQILDTTADVHAFTPSPGDAYDAKRHQGAGRVQTHDRTLDATVARTVRPGFTRGDSNVLRVAEVDVYRFEG